MNDKLKQEIVHCLESYLEAHNMSANAFSKKYSINVSYISAMRSGATVIKAGNDKEVAIADKYYEQIASVVGVSTIKNYWEVVQTPQMERILVTLQDAKEFGYTNVIVGETGSGKSYICNLFARKNPTDCFLITIGSSDNIGDIIDKVIDTIKITTAKTKSKKIKAIINYMQSLKLDGHKPMLIFDESEYMKQPALCAMKELYDSLIGKCALVLVGTSQLTVNLDRLRKKNKEGIPQFYRRIKFGIRQLPSIDRTFKQFLNGIADKGLIKFLTENCDNYGELHDVLVPALREADRCNEPLTERFVRIMLNMPLNY